MMAAGHWSWPGNSVTQPARHLPSLASASSLLSRTTWARLQLARRAQQISAGVPGWIAGWCSNNLAQLLTMTGDLGTAERICAARLARSRDVGDSWSQMKLLIQTATLEQMTGRIDDAADGLRRRTGERASGPSTLRGMSGWAGGLSAGTAEKA